jgi:hypothetical protein
LDQSCPPQFSTLDANLEVGVSGETTATPGATIAESAITVLDRGTGQNPSSWKESSG